MDTSYSRVVVRTLDKDGSGQLIDKDGSGSVNVPAMNEIDRLIIGY